MPAFNEPSKPEDFPPPTADRALLSAFVEAFIATHPKEESLALLRCAASVLHDRETKSSVLLRFKKRDRDTARFEAEADRQAIAIFRLMLPGFVARLVPGDEGED